MKIAWSVCLESICTEEWLVNFESGRLSVIDMLHHSCIDHSRKINSFVGNIRYVPANQMMDSWKIISRRVCLVQSMQKS
jgi:hypothetical protein